MCVRVGDGKTVDVAALRLNYVGFELLEEQARKDPMEQVNIIKGLKFAIKFVFE